MSGIEESTSGTSEPAQQQWILKPSPKKNDSFSVEDSSLSIGSETAAKLLLAVPELTRNTSAASSGSSTPSETQTATPKKQGILRLSATPGTGQSVRFGKRLYDDGDESKMSNSTANSSTFVKSQVLEASEDAIEMSLGFIRSPRKEQGISLTDEDSGQISQDASPSLESNNGCFQDQTSILHSVDTIAMPNMEGYSNIEDISLEYSKQDDTTVPTISRHTKASNDSCNDESFNESFLQAEIERAKRCIGEDDSKTLRANLHQSEDPTSEATVLVRSESEDDIESKTTEHTTGTPAGANSTHGSEYLSTRSQASGHSPASTVSQWNTPRSYHQSPADLSVNEVGKQSADASSAGPSIGCDSPSAQRLQRRVSARPTLPSPSPLFARLKSLTNTPIKRSPLSTVILPPGAFSSDVTEQSIASVIVSDSDAKTRSIFSRSTCTTPSSIDSPSSPSAASIIDELIKETDELDQVHSERSEMLLQWIQDAEQESQQMRRLLEEERERTAAALQEAESARNGMMKMKEEALELEAKRSERLLEVEDLTAKLHCQLEGGMISNDESGGEISRAAGEQRMAVLEEEIFRQKEELERLQSVQEDAKAEIYQAQRCREEEQQKHGEVLADSKEHYENLVREKEEAIHLLQVQLEAIENSREGKLGDEEEEKIELHKKLIELKDENKALQDALVSAQKQIGALQGEEYKDSESLAAVKSELAILEGQLGEVQIALQESRDREQNADMVNQENIKQIESLTATLEGEKAQWNKKYESMEDENDNLLQSLAEAEDHRRSMEDDFLQKRDVALQDSKAREEQALSLAEEMQGRLEKVEAKLQAMTTRTTMLEHEVGDRGLQIVKLEKAKERLEEDNLNYSIALSSKQQELSLLKRNTNRSLRNTPGSATSAAPRMSALASRTSGFSSRTPLKEIQAADESGSSLAPLQSGPTNVKTMRRKTMDVNTPNARSATSNARVVGSTARAARSSTVMPPPPSTVKAHRIVVNRLKSPEEETKVNGPPSRSSSRASQRSSDTMQPSLRSSDVLSRRTSSSSLTVQVRPSLSSSSLASDGLNDPSQMYLDRGASMTRQRIEERSRDLHQARVPVSMPFSSRRSSVGVLLPA